MIPFNKPYLTGKEAHYLYQAVLSGKISGDGIFTKKCHSLFEERYGFQKSLLTTSCTDALEMAAILVNIEPGDEVIAPSYTFVSTVNAFVLRGAKIVFVDCLPDHPNMDVSQIEALITPKTKVILPVHYAGVACDMAPIMELAAKYGLFVIEDAAQAIDSFFDSRPLGGIGHMGAFSFHETKNIISGEGGMLAINEPGLTERAEIIREKGTNRSQFFRGQVDKYSWVDIGSSFLPSDIIAAFLFAQLEHLDDIQAKRKAIWNLYNEKLAPLSGYGVQLPYIPGFATNNAHMFYLVCNSLDERTALIQLLKDNGILSVFHYLSLHKSQFYAQKHDGRALPETDRYADCLVRLPLFYELETEDVLKITDLILGFYHNRFSA
ncbi:dTDP-4-amino-4,6-dideoxygalactose transaminase [Dyadobacter sp. BHUBP1]|uniref:dTDP-4-amino-4,6-dideoxygalactose transaminase n=1 Tax=Dyadobacter sp. BHUBP1 TaxID=3424178 RepID=UPI003D33A1AD